MRSWNIPHSPFQGFLWFAPLLLLLYLSHGVRGESQLKIDPAPAGEPLSGDFELWVNGQPVPVYFKADRREPAYQDDYKRFGKGGGEYSFAYFDFEGPVHVRVRSKQFSEGAVARPASKKITPRSAGGDCIEFDLSKPVKLSLEGRDPKAGLILIARAMEKDPITQAAPGVIYFGPGVHRPGVIELKDGQTLYIAGGAVVKAGIVASGNNITIRGRGIIDGSGFRWPTNPAGHRGFINFVECNKLRMQDVIVRDSPCWTIVPMHSTNVLVEGVTLCNSSNENDDGIDPCNTQRLWIRDCFFRCDDDCVAIKGWSKLRGWNRNVENIQVQRSTFWCDRARIFLLGHESQAEQMRDILFEDCDIVHFTMAPFLVEPADGMTISRVRFSNIRIHGEGQHELIRLRPVELPQYKIPGFGHVENILFENLTLEGTGGAYQVQLYGVNQRHLVRDVSFKGVVIKGNNLATNQTYIKKNEHTRNIRFSP